MAYSDLDRSLGMSRLVLRIFSISSAFAIFAMSIDISSADGSVLLCEAFLVTCPVWFGSGLSYCYTEHEGLEEDIVGYEALEDFSILGEINKNRQGIFGNWLDSRLEHWYVHDQAAGAPYNLESGLSSLERASIGPS